MKKELANLELDSLRNSREYKALVRSLKRRKGFGLLFVECSPAQGEKLIEGVKEDIPQKNVEVLRLEVAVVRVYDLVAEIVNGRAIDILFIMGLESSFYEYESLKRQKGWSSKDIYSYSWKGVPPILDHLNQQRENFRDNFDVCFVFLVPRFVVNYFIQRAPDFFDWRSGLFRLPMDVESLQEESSRICSERKSWENYKTLTYDAIKQELIKIQSLIDEDGQTDKLKADLWIEQGILLTANGEYESAIEAYEKALQIKPENHLSWDCQGMKLCYLGRYESSIEAYEKALQIKPDDHLAWNGKGMALYYLGRYESAIKAYEKVLQIKPDYHYAWNDKGNALQNLKRYKEAIACYDVAIEIKADCHNYWKNKAIALGNLKRYEGAILCYEKAIKLQPNDPDNFNGMGTTKANLERYKEAIVIYEKAIKIQPDYSKTWYNKACCYALQGNAELAIENLQQAINLDGKKLIEKAKTDTDFDKILESDRFQELINQQTDLEIIF